MESLYSKIYQNLIKQKNKKIAEKNKKFHPNNDEYQTLDITMPALKKIFKNHQKEIKKLPPEKQLALAEKLLKNKIEETTIIGIFILQNNLNNFEKTKLSFLDKIFNYFCSWSAVDTFCLNVIQPLLLKYPSKTLDLLVKWNHSKNKWKQRASVVAFTRKIGASGKFTNQALTLCDNLIFSQEKLVQKAVG